MRFKKHVTNARVILKSTSGVFSESERRPAKKRSENEIARDVETC